MSIPGRVDWRHVVSTALGVLAGLVATAGTLAVAVAGFTLSYDAIRKVGIAAGIREDWAWLLPVSIDGAMAVATVTAVVLRRMGRKPWYPWAVVLAGAGISIACNALHAKMRDLIQLDDGTAMAVSAIPAVMLTLSVHLLVVLIESAARTLGEPDAAVVEVAAEPEPDSTPVHPWAFSTPLARQEDATPPAIESAKPAAPKRTTGTPRKRDAVTPGRATGSATRVAEWHAKMPTATNEAIAAKARVSLRTVARHRPALKAAEPDTEPVNGHPVPELVPTT